LISSLIIYFHTLYIKQYYNNSTLTRLGRHLVDKDYKQKKRRIIWPFADVWSLLSVIDCIRKLKI